MERLKVGIVCLPEKKNRANCCFLLTRQVYSGKGLFYRSSHDDEVLIDKNGGSDARGKTSSYYSILFPIYLKRRVSANIYFQICLS